MNTLIIPRLPKILSLLSKKQKVKAIFLLIFILGSLFFEIFSIGIFLPIIETISNNGIGGNEINILNLFVLDVSIITFVWITLGIYLLKTLYMVGLIHFQHYFVYDLQYETANKIIVSSLNTNLEEILNSKSSDTINSVISESTVFAITIVNLLIATFTEILVSVGLIIFVFFYNFKAALILGGILLTFGFIFFRFTRKINKSLGYQRIDIESQRINVLNELFGVIKEVILSANKEFFFSKFNRVSFRYKSIMSTNATMIQLPRVFIDLIIFLAFAIIFLIGISSDSANNDLLNTLSIFALVAIRLMPSFNRVIGNLQSVKFNIRIVDSLFDRLKPDLEVPDSGIDPINLNKSIELRNISFAYKNSNRTIIRDVNIFLEVGKVYGIIGQSGSGKTTLINIISGLLSPSKGEIRIDGIKRDTLQDSWRSNISYVAQDFFILSGSLDQNIALGIEDDKIDSLRIRKSVEDAKLNYKDLKPPFKIAEQGKNLSGGQKQRVALSRCFYKGSPLIILDEATSALDSSTEESIMNDIINQKNEKIIIMITHNNNLLKYCDRVFSIQNGLVHNLLAE